MNNDKNNESLELDTPKNSSLPAILYILAIFTMLSSMIASLIIGSSSYSFEWLPFFITIASGFLLGLFFIVTGKIISLLEEIRDK